MSCVQIGVGQSDSVDAYSAGSRATLAATRQLGESPGVLVVFASHHYDHHQLLAGIASVAGETPLVGGSTAGEISTAGYASGSVVVTAISSSQLRLETGIGLHMSRDEHACGAALASAFEVKDDALALLVFPNGLGGDGVKVIDGLHSVLGEGFEIVGGCLGDDAAFSSTYQYYNGKVYQDTIVGLLISGRGQFGSGIGVRSGFESIGNRMDCTIANGNVVHEIDGFPALHLYKQFLGEHRARRLPGICLEYPFGLIDDTVSLAGKEYFQLRCGFAVDHHQETITLAGSIPEGSPLTLTTASRTEIISSARLAAEQAKASLGDLHPRLIMMFSCVGRRLVLGRRTPEEVHAVQEVLGFHIPLIGFYTYGELGPIDKLEPGLSTARYHNETVVLWVLGCAEGS